MTTRPARIAAIVLAAGRSSRMGGPNKLLELFQGRSIVTHPVTAAVNAGLSPIVVVTGHQADAVADALSGLPVRLVHNPHFVQGMATSLRVGLQTLDLPVDAAMVFLGDMPLVSLATIHRLVEAFEPGAEKTIVAPMVNGRRGNPVLWAACHFEELAAIDGDLGGRRLMQRHQDRVQMVDLGDEGVLMDIDTPEALDSLRRRNQGNYR